MVGVCLGWYSPFTSANFSSNSVKTVLAIVFFLKSVGCGGHFEDGWLQKLLIWFTACYYYLKVLLTFVLFKRYFVLGSWDVLLKGRRHTDTDLQQQRSKVSLLGRCTTNKHLNYICAFPLTRSSKKSVLLLSWHHRPNFEETFEF